MTTVVVERELTVRNLSPLILRADRSRVQHNPTLDYIPGSAIRGALAASYLQNQGDDTPFHAIFAAGRASFGDLLPSESDRPGRLLPATARVCKYYRFRHAASLTDSLLRLEAAERRGDAGSLGGAWKECPKCREKRDRVSGYVTPASPDFEPVTVRKRLLAGTAIQRFTGTAETAMLYSQEALEEGQVFKGLVRFFGDGAAELRANLEQMAPVRHRLTLGAGRSRGTGLIRIEGWAPAFPESPVEDRFDSFNAAWQSLARTGEEVYFSLTAMSHLLLRDRAGLPVTSLGGRPGALGFDTLLGLPDARLHRHVVIPAVARGWNALQGLPKEDEPAIGRGSAFLISVRPGERASLVRRLGNVEAQGLGRRRAEGFGRVVICDSFHFRPLQRELEELRA